LGLEQWSEANLNGKGIRICVTDVGFQNVDKSPVFEKLRKQGQIIKTYDFIKKDTNVYHGGWHGTAVLACIAGTHESTPLGLAEGAEFLLARTEYNTKERFAEEQFWVQAVEWAEKNGADIVNSSLGYSTPRYTTDQMNGKSTFITRAANIAAKKGLLIINAAGNEGNDEWKTIVAPADADSVLTIGGVNSSGLHISFSSFGPTRDLRLKPNLVAPGNVFAPTPNKVNNISGTSFSTPLVSGFAACAWQKFRTLKNMELFKELENSGQLYPYFDYAHGYGIPQAAYFLSKPKVDSSYQTIALNIKAEEESAEIEITQTENINRKLLYYHVANSSNKLIAYYTYNLFDNDGNKAKMVIVIPKEMIKKGNTIRVCRAGEFIEKTIE
jgi:subtilisin family serine protease